MGSAVHARRGFSAHRALPTPPSRHTTAARVCCVSRNPPRTAFSTGGRGPLTCGSKRGQEYLSACCSPPLRQDEALSQRLQLESLFAKDTADAYRVFDTMEHFLRQPEHLRGQLQVQLGGATQVRTYARIGLPILLRKTGAETLSAPRHLVLRVAMYDTLGQ